MSKDMPRELRKLLARLESYAQSARDNNNPTDQARATAYAEAAQQLREVLNEA